MLDSGTKPCCQTAYKGFKINEGDEHKDKTHHGKY